jgi:antitoxin HigA-1
MKPLANFSPAHPGMLIRQHILLVSGLTPADLARMMGLSRPALHYILHGRLSITAATAVRLAAVFGVAARKWLELQQRYDIALAELQLADELASATHYRGPEIDFDRLFAAD